MQRCARAWPRRCGAAGLEIVSPAVERALAERRAGWRAAGELAFFTRGRTKLERGRRARERVELDEATKLLAEAEASYAEGLALPGGASLMAEAALERGLALAELGLREEARAAFRRALVLAPGIALTERVARPDVVKLFKELSRAPTQVARPRRFTVAGQAPSSQTQLSIDGRALPRGSAEGALSAGAHLFVIERDGATLARLVELGEADGVIELPAPHDVVVDRLLSLRSAPSDEAVHTLVESLDLGGALVGVLAADQRRLIVARVADGCTTAAIEIDVASDDSLQRGLAALDAESCQRDAPLSLRFDDPRLSPVAALVSAPVAKPRRPVWPWVFVGALGVTAAVVGVTVGVLASDPRYTLKVDGRGFGAP